jgi:beta-glucosidase
MPQSIATIESFALRRNDFSPDFRWGCSTSSYQIEGASTQDGRGESIWDRFCANPQTIADRSNGAIACDHYHRWPQDLDIAHQLGTNAYRFSIAWPRIFPHGRGKPNQLGLDFYSRLVDGMLERNLEPWCTLYHWDLPQTLQDQGGWASRETVSAFETYADVVSRCLGDRIKHWMTHNEPWCTAFLGNYEGCHAPGNRDLKTALQVCHNVLVSHGSVVPAIRSNSNASKVGIALSLHPLRAGSELPQDIAAKVRHDGLRNRWFLDPLHGRGYPADIVDLLGANAPVVADGDLALIATPTDFLGVNYYFPEVVVDAPGEGMVGTRVIESNNVERTAFGWEVSPQGMVDLLARIAADYKPQAIYITENGSTYDDVVTLSGTVEDIQRRTYLQRHLLALREIVQRGIPVKGYFAWSLLDNFEWAMGYIRRFGLTYVDFETQRRILKSSGQWYAEFLKDEEHTS